MGFQDFGSLLPNFTTQIYGCNFIYSEGAILWAESFRLARARTPCLRANKNRKRAFFARRQGGRISRGDICP